MTEPTLASVHTAIEVLRVELAHELRNITQRLDIQNGRVGRLELANESIYHRLEKVEAGELEHEHKHDLAAAMDGVVLTKGGLWKLAGLIAAAGGSGTGVVMAVMRMLEK